MRNRSEARLTSVGGKTRDALTGFITDDGILTLDGSGALRDEPGASWRYRFRGRFEGRTLHAEGAMLTRNLGATLRACSMRLVRSGQPVRPMALHAAAPAIAPVAEVVATASPAPLPSPSTTPSPSPSPTVSPSVSPAAGATREADGHLAWTALLAGLGVAGIGVVLRARNAWIA